MSCSALLTDLYELTMLAGYFDEGMAEQEAVFDLYFRQNPFEGGYAVFAGLEPALENLENFTFSRDEIDYLHSLKLFKPPFLAYLEQFRFQGQVIAPPEGTVVFAHTPLLSLRGTLAETQLVEAMLLNIINFQTLVATKAARICHAAAPAEVIEFGLRRAQGPDGSVSAARAACVGGARGTSNVLAGQLYNLPVRGTHAHSWVQSFDSELTAFRAYAKAFPDSTVLLVDTFDTLQQGVPNAITVARELKEEGYNLRGIRLDSGDLAYLSREARAMLDAAGFPEVQILASNEVDELVIDSIKDEGGAVDIYGVGTKLATAAGAGGVALGGVYKLVEFSGRPKMKITSDPSKTTLPGGKRVLRALGPQGEYLQDLICLEQDQPQGGERVYDPTNPARHTTLPQSARLVELRQVVMEGGKRLLPVESIETMASRAGQQLALLPAGCRRFCNPHLYKVSISAELKALRSRLMNEAQAHRSSPHE